MSETKEHITQLKHDCQLKITLHFLLAYLADQRNNDQKTALTMKIYSGGKYLEFMSYIPFQKFLTNSTLESRNIAQLQIFVPSLILGWKSYTPYFHYQKLFISLL